MKNSFLLVLTTLFALFAEPLNEWTTYVNKPNITAATVDPNNEYVSSRYNYYYILNKDELFCKSESTDVSIPVHLQDDSERTELNTINIWGSGNSKKILLGTNTGLYEQNVKSDNDSFSLIASTNGISISQTVIVYNWDTPTCMYLKSEEKKLYRYTDTTLEEIVPTFDSSSLFENYEVVSLESERHYDDQIISTIFRLYNDQNEKYLQLYLYPSGESTPQMINKERIDNSSQFLHIENSEVGKLEIISQANKLFVSINKDTIQMDSLFDVDDTIKDITLLERSLPVAEPRFKHVGSVISIASTKGTRIYPTWEFFQLDFLYDDPNPGTALKIIDLPAKYELQNSVFVINEEGISGFTMEVGGASLPQSQSAQYHSGPQFEHNALSISLHDKQSGTLSLLTLKGQKLTAVNFVHSNKVLLSTTTTLAKGVYLLKLQTESGISTQKVTIQ